MKTAVRIIAAGLAASLALVSCAKQDAIDNGSTSPADGVRTIAVSFANASVKSELGEDGLTPKFVANDEIKVSNGTTAEECTVSIDGSGNASITTSLTGTLTMVYPSTAAKMDGNAIDGILVPTVQDGTFASANICKAIIAEGATEASFENQTAIFKLSVPAKVDDKGVDYVVKSLAVKSIGENNIAEGSKEIKVGDGTSTIAAENGFYYVSVLPGETSSNLYVCAGAGARKLTGEDAIAINKIYSVSLPVLNGHEYVEIGGFKWSTMNVGATKPEDYGEYFAWGETTGHSLIEDWKSKWSVKELKYIDVFNPNNYSFDWAHTPYHTGSNDYSTGWTKYITSKKPSYWSGTGDPDDKLVLDQEDDAACANWGGSWRMPTKPEFQALKNAAYWAWDVTDTGYYVFAPDATHTAGTIANSVPGGLNKADALLFFPAAGMADGASLCSASSYGYYWSSSLQSTPIRAHNFNFYNGEVRYQDYSNRYVGHPVRPVSD